MNKIMVIEKDEDLSVHIMKLLNKEQYDAIEIIDPEHLFSRIYSFQPDLFVIGHDCIDIQAKLKAFEPVLHIPIVYIPKPAFDAAWLLDAVKESFQQRAHIASLNVQEN